MEGLQHSFEHEDDPRTNVANKFRDFFLQAISHQRVIDASMQDNRPAGTLYKMKDGKLFIHLEVPARDLDFDTTDESPIVGSRANYPPLWVMIHAQPKPSQDIMLEDEVISADVITIHVVPENQSPYKFEVRDDYIGPTVPEFEFETLNDLESYDPSVTLTEQLSAADYWLTALSEYDIRTVTSTQVDAA